MPNDQDFESLNAIALACYEMSASKGWHEDLAKIEQLEDLARDVDKALATEDDTDAGDPIRWAAAQLHFAAISEKLALIHSEVSEALEDHRNPELDPVVIYYADKTSTTGRRVAGDPYFHPGSKPEGFPIELADAVIRVFDLAGRLGIDLGAAIKLKMEYNATRPHRHGGKRA